MFSVRYTVKCKYYLKFMNVSARGIKVLGSGLHGPNVDRSN